MKISRPHILALLLCAAATSFAGEWESMPSAKTDARLAEVLQRLSPTDEVLAWVFFTDKGSHEFLKASVPHNVVSERSIQRRLKVRLLSDVVDYTDLPVEKSYVDQIAPHVNRVRQMSKWFNGVSVSATRNQIERLESLPFVAKTELLTRFKRNISEEELTSSPSSNTIQQHKDNSLNSFDYGLSFAQVNQINVPAVHNLGNYGQGVIIGVLDNGFRLLNHEAFDSLRLVATYDFVDHKVSVVPNNPDPGFGAHGIITLSAIAGFKPGQLIGPAFGARYILARTENDSSETPLEEDNWLAAIEWADSLGVDVTSTSLGYLTYDPPYPSWTWEQMNGNTTVITRAADMAVARGIVVCNSAGNNGLNTVHNTLNAPADGDSVLSIGAVTIDGQRANFSSVGPTTSVPARIKPDVMAQGVTVRCASWTDPTQYTYSGGTSLSCPLAAGVAALLVHAKPSLTPVQIANAMRQTASRASTPDNLFGWGILNALSAVTSVGGLRTIPTTYSLLQNYPNPFNPKTTIQYYLPQSSVVSLKIYNLLGQEVRTLVSAARESSLKTIEWNGTNNSGNILASGVYFARLNAKSIDNTISYTEIRKLVLSK